MKRIHLTKKYEGKFVGKRLNENDYDQLLEEDAEVFGPDGELLLVFKKQAIPAPELAAAWPILRKINPKTENRGTATGVEMVARVKQDGTKSNTLRVPKGMEVVSGVIGFYERYPRIPFCRACAWNDQHPQEYQQLLPLFQKVSDLHGELAPESYAFQKEWSDKTSPDFVIPGTIYSTVTINKNFRTAAHLDAKNLHDGMASMLLLREGKYAGGYVVLPEYRVAVAMDSGDLIIFRNMKDLHGNTPIIPLSKNYQRCTLVFYYREGMINCGTIEQELERAKNHKPGDPIRSINLNEAQK